MIEYNFLVQGSADEPYEVWISKSGNNLTATCTCPAGRNFSHCKHRLMLLDGSPKGVVCGDIDKISSLPKLLIGTDVEGILKQLKTAEFELDKAKKEVSNLKKALARKLQK